MKAGTPCTSFARFTWWPQPTAGPLRKDSEHISCALNMALFLGLGENMVLFRKSLALLIRRRLKVIRAAPPPHVRRHQDWVLSSFCAQGPKARVRRCTLQALLNGDWTCHQEVQVYLAPEVEVDLPKLQEQVIQGVMLALASRTLRQYPRHRWLGAEGALDDILLLQCVHGLCSAAFLHMCLGVDPLDDLAASRALSSLETTSQPPGGAAGDELDVVLQETGPSSGWWGNAAHAFLDPALPVQDSGESTNMSELAYQNSQRRNKVCKWWQSHPLAPLILIRLCIRPLAKLLGGYIERSGQDWLQEQRMAQTVLMALHPEHRTFNTSALLEAVNAVGEAQFFEDLATLLKEEDWDHVPPSHWTVGFQGLAFRLTSKMGCLVKELCEQQSRTFPLRLFRLLSSTSSLADILATKPCVLDNFTATYLATYPQERAVSREGLSLLTLLAMVIYPDIVHLEWTHGRTHRLLKSQSVQTKAPTISSINAQMVIQKYKERLQHCSDGSICNALDLAGLAPPADDPGDGDEAHHDAREGRRGGGGAWRAWTSQRARGSGSRPDWSNLAVEYRQAQMFHTEEYQAAMLSGQAATTRHAEHLKRSRSSFGPYTRDVHRKLGRSVPGPGMPLTGTEGGLLQGC